MGSICAQPIEIFLQPGDFFFGDHSTRVRTLLGSCVSITLWHRRFRIGGMCHYMLPVRSRRASRALDGRYADDVMALFMHELRISGTNPRDYDVKIFGGGRMLAHNPVCKGTEVMEVGVRNIETARRLLSEHGFRVKAEHIGGDGHRNVVFDVGSGEVWIRHVAPPSAGGWVR